MREDDAKSGVGAQRGGGLHKAYVKALQDKVKEEVVGSEGVSRARSPSPSAESNSSSSSSLFTEHFPKVSCFVPPVGRVRARVIERS